MTKNVLPIVFFSRISLLLLTLINPSDFQLNALKPGINGFSKFASPLALSVFMCDPSRGYSGHLDFIFDYWHHVLESVVSDLWPRWITASAEGCLSACIWYFLYGKQKIFLNL